MAATLHVLFHRDTPLQIPDVISEAAIQAAVNFVDHCIQNAAHLAGRGDIQEAIQSIQLGMIL